MDLQFFLNILLKRKWLILASIILAGAAAYFYVDRQQNTYRADAIVTTGIMGAQGLNLDREVVFVQQHQIEMSLANLIEVIQSRANINLLGYQLLLHDLKESPDRPFRLPQYGEDQRKYSESQINDLVLALQPKVDSLDPYLNDPQIEMVFHDLSRAYGYDHESLMKNLGVARRNQESDLLSIAFISENPELSAYTVNTFTDIFLKNHRYLQREEDLQKVEFYSKEARATKKKINAKEEELRQFRSNNNLVDLENQKQANVNQIKELELKKEEEEQKLVALRQNLKQLDTYLGENAKDSDNKTKSLLARSNIPTLQKQLKELNEAYINSGLTDNKLRIRLEATKRQLDDQLELLSDSRKSRDLDIDNSEGNILIKKIDTELNLNFAMEAIASIDIELNRLRAKSVVLVSEDAVIQNMENELELLQAEYKNLSLELKKADINLKSVSNQLNLMEHAQVPDAPEPKKKLLLAGFAGIVSGTLVTLLIFILSYFDTSFSSPQQFQKFTRMEVLGTLNEVKTNKLDMELLFNSNGQIKPLDYFKESLRELRFNIENSKASTFLFTSTKVDEGKSFMQLALAQSFKVKNKKVLLLDTNFKHNSLTQMSTELEEPNLEIQKLLVDHQLADVFGQRKLQDVYNLHDIDVIANTGNYLSPSEIFAGKDFHTFLDKLTLHYDYIFFEAPAMNRYSDAKELSAYADRVIAVFSAESELKSADRNSLDFLRGLGQRFMGAILNKVDLKNLA